MVLSAFYEAIMARLKDKVPALKHIDLYYGQDLPNEGENDLPFNRPAALFEYEPMEWETIGNKRKVADIRFRLHIISDVIQEVSSTETPAIRNLGHQHLETLDAIDKALTGFWGDFFNTIAQTDVEPYAMTGPVYSHILTFKTRLNNDAAYLQLVPPAGTVDQTIVVQSEITP